MFLMNASQHILNPLGVNADFRENRILFRVAECGRRFARTQADDAMQTPLAGIPLHGLKETAPAVAVAHGRAVGPAGAECGESDELLEVCLLFVTAFLIRYDGQAERPQRPAVMVLLRQSMAGAEANTLIGQMRCDVVQIPIDANRTNVLTEWDGAIDFDKRNVRAVIAEFVEIQRMHHDRSCLIIFGKLIVGIVVVDACIA